MASSRNLKVFRTSAGFHDAYVAVPSQKAALAAWGADKNLFSMKAAELVTDPKLMQLALEHPGEVIRVSKGTAADHVRAAGVACPQSKAKPGKKSPRRKSRAKPRPSRRALSKAEDILAEFERSARDELSVLRAKEEELRHRRGKLQVQMGKKRSRLTARVKAARRLYQQRLTEWE